jgi:hypothetical protein
MKPWIHLGHMPLLVLLGIAAAACLLLIAELRGRPIAVDGSASVGQRLTAGLGGMLVMLLAGAVLFLIAAFIGLGFGPFYLILTAAVILLVLFPAFGIPRISRTFERMTTRQLSWRGLAVIAVCLALAVLYVAGAGSLGFPLRFGPVPG